jgi:trk system potassium uptake protein TrkH
VSLTLVLLVAMALSLIEYKQPFLSILFETTSAFATVGLSLGVTPELSLVGKIIISVMMFIGRLGPLTLTYWLTTEQRPVKRYYPEGKIII